jgi:hypothetical protein
VSHIGAAQAFGATLPLPKLGDALQIGAARLTAALADTGSHGLNYRIKFHDF